MVFEPCVLGRLTLTTAVTPCVYGQVIDVLVDAEQLEHFVLLRIGAETIDARAQQLEQSRVAVLHHPGEQQTLTDGVHRRDSIAKSQIPDERRPLILIGRAVQNRLKAARLSHWNLRTKLLGSQFPARNEGQGFVELFGGRKLVVGYERTIETQVRLILEVLLYRSLLDGGTTPPVVE